MEAGILRHFLRPGKLCRGLFHGGKIFLRRRHFRFQLRETAAAAVTALTLQGAQPRFRLRKRAVLLARGDERGDLFFELRTLPDAYAGRPDERRALKYRQ